MSKQVTYKLLQEIGVRSLPGVESPRRPLIEQILGPLSATQRPRRMRNRFTALFEKLPVNGSGRLPWEAA